MTCNRCKQPGHVAKRCRAVCDVCGEAGHVGALCPTKATCGHCGYFGHAAATCSFGLEPQDRFLFCAGSLPASGCFARHFLVPLQRAAVEFDVERLREGRVDVGLRCITATFFRSQSLRTNAQITLAFGASLRSVQISGALVRDLRPDERSLAERVRAVAASDAYSPDLTWEGDLRAWSQSPTRGFFSFPGGPMEALQRALRAKTTLSAASEAAGAASPPPAVVLLTAAGKPVEQVLERLVARDGLQGGVLVLLGDDRGFGEADEVQIRSVVKAAGARLSRASLGGDVLFASHSIVLMNHYLDKLVHSCELKPAREYSLAQNLS